MEAIYQEICSELGLDPSSPARFPRDSSLVVACFQGETGSVWAPIVAGRTWGCRACLGSSLQLLEQHYADFDRPDLLEDEAIELIFRMLDRHGIPTAVNDIYGPQCWSVCFPVPDCMECRDAPRQLTDYATAFPAVRIQTHGTESADTGGRRAAPAADFVAANRAAIGFVSIVSNPYDGGDEPYATLIEGLIRTSTNLSECEVAGGKGLNTDQALASFLGEGLERYFAADPFHTRVVVGIERELAAAIDPILEFGYPANDTTAGIEAYSPERAVEWVLGENLTLRNDVFVPANLAFCPYMPRDSTASRFTVTITTGVATGANVEDATLQALLELIERDAFWYFARTGQSLAALPIGALHPYVADAIQSIPGRFTFHALPNPFDVPVVHVTYVADDDYETRTARGIGAAEDTEQASLRAFVECLQILHSLSLAIEVDPVDGDMRHIWFTGEAMDLLPNFFQDSAEAALPSGTAPRTEARFALSSLIEVLTRESITLYRVVIADSPSFAVVRVLASGMCLTDATYFTSSDRLAEFARSLPSAPAPRVAYAGPTFM